MNIYTKIATDFHLLQSQKYRVEEEVKKLNVLKLIYAEFQRRPNLKIEPSDDYSISVLKKYVKNNEELLSHISDPIKVQDIKIENSIIESYLPKSVSEDEIKDFLFSSNLDRSNHNKLIGLTIKHFKEQGLLIDGSMVKKVIDSII